MKLLSPISAIVPTQSISVYSSATPSSKVPSYTIDPQTCQQNLILIVLGLKESEHEAISNSSSTALVELENALAQHVRKSSPTPPSTVRVRVIKPACSFKIRWHLISFYNPFHADHECWRAVQRPRRRHFLRTGKRSHNQPWHRHCEFHQRTRNQYLSCHLHHNVVGTITH